jgi:hypothetical protein
VMYVLEWGKELTHFLNIKKGSLSRVEYNKPNCQVATGIKLNQKSFSSQQILWVNSLGNRTVTFVESIRQIQVFDLRGKKVWETSVPQYQKQIILPSFISNDILFLRLFK